MDKRAAGHWSSTDLSDKCPPYPSDDSTEALNSNASWTSEKFSNDALETPIGSTTRFRELTLNNDRRSQKYIDWDLKWQQQPAFIILCASSGHFLAVAHHLFYSRLNHTLTGTQGRQQLAHAFGNVLAISVATSFAFTCRNAYKQYFWTVVRRKSFTIKVLDSLYSLTSDVSGLLNLEVWRQAPLAAILALACW